ncbi:MAG: sporulation integral membrane protein YtvI [Lachnospiraceae bacterium]|jgi:sporulation integral membrane protein YtvI|nr:sporulation integral membrane protein YtvI [Lachnospiraceae bacterium]
MNNSTSDFIKDNRPYWKVVVSFIFSILATVAFIYIGVRFVFWFFPFVVGWFLAYLATPLVNLLERKLKIRKKLSSAIIIIIVLGLLVLLIYFIVSRVAGEVTQFTDNMPGLYDQAEKGFSQIGDKLQGVFHNLPNGIQNGLDSMTQNLDKNIEKIISKASKPTVDAATNFAKKIPGFLIGLIVSIISAYFLIAERDGLIKESKRVAPGAIVRRMTMVMDNLKYAVGGYFKAQFKIMGVVFVILLIGLMILGSKFSIILAICFAFLDFLPFFGTGTALVPWAVYKFMVGEIRFAVGLLIIYGVTQLVRQLIQPKLLSDSMELNPLLTLFLLYAGYLIHGVLGMILAVPVGMIIINLYKAKAFDYILDDLKILVDGILNLRNKESR